MVVLRPIIILSWKLKRAEYKKEKIQNKALIFYLTWNKVLNFYLISNKKYKFQTFQINP